MKKVQASTNRDEVSRFWSKLLPFLNAYVGYYISIRSGNWLLRNACLRAVAPLFFAYNHNKYEELCTTAIKDSLTLPSDILQQFLNGGWTVSVKGRPHHNFALDEAHETIINLRLKTITSRPSHFRTVELANFMSYLDKVVRGVEGMIYRSKQKEPSQYRKRYVCQRTARMITMLKDVILFQVSDTPKQLCNMLWNNKRPLDSKTIDDLLSISSTGIERMQRFVQEYILPPPTTGPRKRRKRTRKLATFTYKAATARESKKREHELSNIAKNAMQILQANGICTQTSPYPLAIADIQGNMRSSQKSKFLETLTRCLQFDRAVANLCPLLSQPPQDLCVIIDMLYFVHMPPPPSVVTFNDYFTHLWSQTIGKYIFRHRAAHLVIILDKPEFLPPPRSIVHTTRAKSAQDTKVEPTVAADEHIPHNRTYSSLLSTSQTFKINLLEFITTQIVNKAVVTSGQFNFSLTIDSPSLSVVQTISSGNIHNSPNNEHGEADYAVWHHCIHAGSNNILIVSCDTDTWVYGLGLCELNFFRGKQVYIQRGNVDSYIHINQAVSLISQHPNLSSMEYPVLSLVALYILTGCDYVSSFYMCTKTKFLETLIENLSFICPTGGLLKMISNEFQYINEESWL